MKTSTSHRLTPAQFEANVAGAWEAAQYLAAQGRLYSWREEDRTELAAERALAYVARLGYGAEHGAQVGEQFRRGFLGLTALLLGEVECNCTRRGG